MQTHTEKQKLLEIHCLKLIFLSLFKESHSWVITAVSVMPNNLPFWAQNAWRIVAQLSNTFSDVPIHWKEGIAM